MPAITTIGQTQVQILKASAVNELTEIEPEGRPGRQTQASKKTITIECGSGWIQVSKLKINRGKGLDGLQQQLGTDIQTCSKRVPFFICAGSVLVDT